MTTPLMPVFVKIMALLLSILRGVFCWCFLLSSAADGFTIVQQGLVKNAFAGGVPGADMTADEAIAIEEQLVAAPGFWAGQLNAVLSFALMSRA